MRGDRYIDIPGFGTHELPPLLVRSAPEHGSLGESEMEAAFVEAEEMLPDYAALDVEQRKLDLALNLAEQYRAVVTHWAWGDAILEWVRQCEITFESDSDLRHLLHPDVWPHASRSSFVTLLVDKAVMQPGALVEKAVGLRLTFRQPPPLDCFSNQFLLYLHRTIAGSAYEAWAQMGKEDIGLLPPNRFHFDVVDLDDVASAS